VRLAVLGGGCFVVGFIVAVILAKTLLAPLQPIRFDMDGDRKLSFVELRSALSAVFDLVDIDGNGRITPEEGRALTKESEGGLPSMIAARVRFQRFDTNKDGVISLNEVRNPAEFKRLFKELDRNSDGHIDSSELEKTGLGVVLIRD